MIKLKLFCFVLLLALGQKAALGQHLVWQKTYGAGHNDYITGLQLTADGGFIISGLSQSGASGDKSEDNWDLSYATSDMWIIKCDSLGNIEWENTIGGTKVESNMRIIVAPNGDYLIGCRTTSNLSGDKTMDGCNPTNNYGDYWMIRLEGAGGILWQKSIAGLFSESFQQLMLTDDDGILLGGTSSSNISCDKTENNLGVHTGTSDYWLVKTDSSGNIIWDNTLGGGQWCSDFFATFDMTASGDYIVGGTSSGQWHGNDKTEPPVGGADYWILKLTPSGTVVWNNVIGGTLSDNFSVIKSLPDGGFICGGSSNSDVSGDKTEMSYGGFDYWVLRLDSLGNILWQKTIGGMLDDNLADIMPLPDGGFMLAGTSKSPVSGIKTENNVGDNDAWLVKLDSIGNLIWQNTIGGLGSDNVSRISAAHEPSQYYVTIQSSSGIGGDKTENSFGGFDYWVIKIIDSDTSTQNKITGQTFADLNSNSFFDANDITLQNKRIDLSTGIWAYSNPTGNYLISTSDTGTISISPGFNLNYFTSVPTTQTASFGGFLQTDSLNDFAFQPNAVVNDLKVQITPVNSFRSGMNGKFKILFTNIGTTTLSGDVVIYLDSSLSYTSSSVTPATIHQDSVTWTFSGLLPFASGEINLNCLLAAGLPIGTLINPIVKIEPLAGDTNTTNNYSSREAFIIGSFDPNNIIVDQDTLTTTQVVGTAVLDYIINFQNTGNDTAFYVRLLNPIDTSKLILSSFEFIDSSHPLSIQYTPWEKKMEFVFENILLPDSNINEDGSHGFVRYRIQVNPALSANDSIRNNAYIYFDYNSPVETNYAITEIVYPHIYTHIYDTLCGPLVSPSGNYTWYDSGIHFDTIASGTGIDSVLVFHLTTLNTFATQSVADCDSMVSPGGSVYFASGTYIDVLSGANYVGCDSIITINFINNTVYDSQNIISCGDYVSPSGNYNWSATGIYNDTIVNGSGCNTYLTINLEVINVDTSVTINAPYLIANASSATYQWLYCDSITLPGDTGSVFLPVYNGNYAVIVAQNGCTDTSSCITVLNVGVSVIDGESIKIYPVPADQHLYLMVSIQDVSETQIAVYDLTGKLILLEKPEPDSYKEAAITLNVSSLVPGIYHGKLMSSERSRTFKFIKN